MKKLNVLFEEVLKEYQINGDTDYELFEMHDNFIMRILQKFLEENNEDYTLHMPWRLIPYPRLKKIWEEWAKFGFVRDVQGLEMIEDIMISNTIKIGVMSVLAGHTTESPDEYFEDGWGEYIDDYLAQYSIINGDQDANNPSQLEFDWNSKNGDGLKKKVIPPNELIKNPFLDRIMDGVELNKMNKDEIRNMLLENLKDKFFWYYIEDPEIGQMRISDYGLSPLIKLVGELRSTNNDSTKVVIIDKMLNVIHQRSDMASWFVRGGSKALSDLSSSPSEKEVENEN